MSVVNIKKLLAQRQLTYECMIAEKYDRRIAALELELEQLKAERYEAEVEHLGKAVAAARSLQRKSKNRRW